MVLELILQRLASCQHFPLYGLGLGFEVLFVFRNVLTFSKSINILLFICFALFFDHSVACGTLVSQPGIQQWKLGVKVPNNNHWTAREFPGLNFFFFFNFNVGKFTCKELHFLRRSVIVMVKNLPAMQETWVRSLGWEDSLKKGMATHCSILAWRIPWTEDPGWLQSTGLQRVRHDWAANTHKFGGTQRNYHQVKRNNMWMMLI